MEGGGLSSFTLLMLILYISAAETSAGRMCNYFVADIFSPLFPQKSWKQLQHRDIVLHTTGNSQTVQAGTKAAESSNSPKLILFNPNLNIFLKRFLIGFFFYEGEPNESLTFFFCMDYYK